VILILFSITYLTLSCSKQTNEENTTSIDIPDGYVALNIEMDGIQIQEEKLADIKKPTVKINESVAGLSNISNTPNSGFNCTVSLEPVSNESNNVKSSLKEKGKLAELKTKEVELNTHYRVYAYDKATGALATSKSYIRGQ
jgi:hypothetical protein